MRNQGKIKLGFYPLPVAEAVRLKNFLVFPERFSAVDPCIGDGVAFAKLLEGVTAHRYGIEIDAHRAEQAKALGIQTLQANALDVRCPTEGISLLYLNPPYDFEAGANGNQRLERVFLEHTYRWLKPAGVLVFVIPQPQLQPCARLLAEHFTHLRIYRLSDPACLQYKQIAVLAARRKRNERTSDSTLLDSARYLEGLSSKTDLAVLPDEPDGRYEVPGSQEIVLTNTGIPLDEIENLLPTSAAYRQASRVLLREQASVRGRPLTPLHGGHVGLLCTAGMLNGVFGDGEDRHIAHWRSVKFTDHWEEEEPDGTILIHDRERFSHELTLIFSSGKTQVLTHEKQNPS
jgi:SAM-dependent methyltransferase